MSESTSNPNTAIDDAAIDDRYLEQQLFADMQDDEEDSQSALLEDMALFDPRTDFVSSSLLKYLETAGTAFPVSKESHYGSPVWHLDRGIHAHACNVHFDRTLEGSNDLKRAIIFHCIPEHAPFGNIRATATTKAKGRNYGLIEKYVFADNKLTALEAGISIITAPMINDALDRAKNAESKSHYINLYTMLKLWLNLSNHKLIPEGLRLQVESKVIETPERRQEVLSAATNRLQSWISYSEEELETLIEYALFWTEKAIPPLLELKNYILNSSLNDPKSKYALSTTRHLPALVEAMTVTVEGKKVFEPGYRPYMNGDIQMYRYGWVTAYGVPLDKIRNAIFILVALITGARASELAIMKFSDVTCDLDGDYWINVTRFKTAQDKNFSGQADRLPLPKFIGEVIQKFHELKQVGRFAQQEYLFQACQSARIVKKVNSGLITFVINQLKDELPIDRLHAHRFRKTIAEILINRDERNIDIIRRLFGHSSFQMTLQYIARNPIMVRSIALTIEQNFTKDLHEIVASIKWGYSGFAGTRIAKQIQTRPGEFSGTPLKMSILAYITNLLNAGEPIFVRRTALGMFCITGEHYTESSLPPCIAKTYYPGDAIMPNPANCQIDCKKIVILQKAKQSLIDNIAFYESILNAPEGEMSPTARREISRRIQATQDHLNGLEATQTLPDSFYPDAAPPLGHSQPSERLIEVVNE